MKKAIIQFRTWGPLTGIGRGLGGGGQIFDLATIEPRMTARRKSAKTLNEHQFLKHNAVRSESLPRN